MKTEAITLALFIFIILSVVRDIFKRIHFNKGINQHNILLLKHKDFRNYSPGNLLLGFFVILLEIWKFKGQSDVLNYLGLFTIVIVNISAGLKLTNFTAINDEGIRIDGKLLKWEKVELISKDEYGFSITVKNTNHRIRYNEFENETEFKKSFTDGIRRYAKTEFTKIKI